MLKHRVIPSLLLSNNRLVKTTNFKDPKYVGDPINAIRIFNDKEVDELMVLDISASKQKIEPNYDLIEQFASECFMPLAYGGGVTSLEQAKRIFSLGVEKICLQTAAINNPRLIAELSSNFGSQSIMVSIDVRRNWLGQPQIYESATAKILKSDYITLAKSFVDAGAGEILLNSVNKDGTLSGPDISLINDLSLSINVPIIGLGGVSSMADIKSMVDAGASAVAAGSFFVFHGPHRAVLITYPKYSDLESLLNNQSS